MPKAYSYIRFSTPEQEKGDSLRRQMELSEKYAEAHGLALDDSLHLRDLGLSAYSGEHRDRGALGGFLKLVEAGKIEKGSILLVESLDRLSREEITEALNQFLGIIGAGIKIVTLADNHEYTKETINANVGELIISLTIMARAHEESATKSLRLGKAWENKRVQAANGTRKLTATCPAWLELNSDKTKFEVIEERAEVIRTIFSMRLAGKGLTAIIRELNLTAAWKPDSNDPRKRPAQGWRESYVRRILSNRAVIGEYQPHKLTDGKRQPVGNPIPDYFPAVMDKDVFYRVQDQLKQNIRRGGRLGQVANLFPYIAKCGYCGGPMAYLDKGPGPKGGKYLVCDRARRRAKDCCKASVRYPEFENLVLTYCKGLRPQDILNDNNDTERILLQNEFEGKTGELNSIRKEIENIADTIARTSDQRVRDIFEKRMSEKLDERDKLTQILSHLKQQIDTLSRSFEETQLTLDSLNELFRVFTKAKDQKLIDTRLKVKSELRKLIRKIDIYPEGNPRFTVQTAQKALKEISSVAKDKEVMKQIRKEMIQRVENPKQFRFFYIRFSSGSIRSISPESILQLAWEFDKEGKAILLPSEKQGGN